MKSTMSWPDALIDDVAARRAVLFFGSGISQNSVGKDGKTRPKTWWTFLERAAKKMKASKKVTSEVKKLLRANDLLLACEIIKREMKRDAFVDLMKDEFQKPAYEPAAIHAALWSLDFRISITPNFDSIYDSLASQRGAGTVTIKNYDADDIADCLRRKERLLIKSHGSISQPDKMIFTSTDYANARNSHRDFYDLINSLLRTHTFLFIGCGLDDPDIKMLLEDYCYRHKYTRHHYFVVPSKRLTPRLKEVYQDSRRLELVEYKYTKNHEHLLLGVKQLAKTVDQRRNELSESQQW